MICVCWRSHHGWLCVERRLMYTHGSWPRLCALLPLRQALLAWAAEPCCTNLSSAIKVRPVLQGGYGQPRMTKQTALQL
jgi:hypothetical protein